MAPSRQLRLVLVTPETTLLDEPVEALQFPLYDGQIGILPGRAPAVGRLGFGELKITRGGQVTSYFLEGGFVQVKGPVVSLLTNRAVKASELNEQQAESQLAAASSRVPTNDLDFAAKERDQERARKMLALAHKSK